MKHSIHGLFLASGLLILGACATGAAPAASGQASGPVELAGTRWKLPMTEGNLDGRTIEFKRGAANYQGVLVNVGRYLSGKVGAYEGLVLMELVPEGATGTFKGFERVPGRDELTEVFCSVTASGREMKCSAESTPWTREL